MKPGKANIYLGDQIADELTAEAARTGKTASQLMQRAWRIARDQIQRLQPGTELDDTD